MAPVLLAAAACGAGGADRGGDGAEAESAASPGPYGSSGAALEMAVSEICPRDWDAQCVSIHGESILVDPAGFETVGVESVDREAAGAIGVTLDSDGIDVAQRLTTEALHAGEHARLVMRVDSELLSAPRVQGEMHGAHLLITVPPGVDAVAVAEKLDNGAD